VPNWDSIRTAAPSTKPASFRPWLKARRRSAFGSGQVGCRKPITGIAGCCARAASGQLAAAAEQRDELAVSQLIDSIPSSRAALQNIE